MRTTAARRSFRLDPPNSKTKPKPNSMCKPRSPGVLARLLNESFLSLEALNELIRELRDELNEGWV
jgi:hypothetical protein